MQHSTSWNWTCWFTYSNPTSNLLWYIMKQNAQFQSFFLNTIHVYQRPNVGYVWEVFSNIFVLSKKYCTLQLFTEIFNKRIHDMIFVTSSVWSQHDLDVISLLFQGKLQKHQAFEAEISAHSNAIVELQENGESMISESHYASDLIRVSYVYTHILFLFCYSLDRNCVYWLHVVQWIFHPTTVKLLWFSVSL